LPRGVATRHLLGQTTAQQSQQCHILLLLAIDTTGLRDLNGRQVGPYVTAPSTSIACGPQTQKEEDSGTLGTILICDLLPAVLVTFIVNT
jgi:hypothetical protein